MSPKVPISKAPPVANSAVAQQPTSVKATPSAKSPTSQDGFSSAAKGLLAHKSSPLVSGALKIFGDNVVLPAHLTDPENPQNDVKYLRLLSAVLGLDDLEKYFFTVDDKKHQEFLERKEKKRKEKWAEIEKEKEEKRRKKREEKGS